MRYKTNEFGMLMRCFDGRFELYNFKTKQWKPSRYALAAFIGEDDAWDITEEEAAAMTAAGLFTNSQ